MVQTLMIIVLVCRCVAEPTALQARLTTYFSTAIMMCCVLYATKLANTCRAPTIHNCFRPSANVFSKNDKLNDKVDKEFVCIVQIDDIFKNPYV